MHESPTISNPDFANYLDFTSPTKPFKSFLILSAQRRGFKPTRNDGTFEFDWRKCGEFADKAARIAVLGSLSVHGCVA
jgi:hypothetical protein